MVKHLDEDTIQRRLGNSNRPRSQYDDYGSAPQNSPDPAPEDQGSGLGFIIGIVGCAVVLGGAAPFFLNGSIPLPSLGGGWGSSAYASSEDATCRRDWHDGGVNNDQVYCYMTQNTRRLCKAEEKRHLIATIEKYQQDFEVWNVGNNLKTYQAVSSVSANSMQFGMDAAKLDNPDLSDEQRAEIESNMSDFVKEANGKISSLRAEIDRNKRKPRDLENALKSLLSQGLLNEEDFGWTQPKWVKAALKKAQKGVANSC